MRRNRLWTGVLIFTLTVAAGTVQLPGYVRAAEAEEQAGTMPEQEETEEKDKDLAEAEEAADTEEKENGGKKRRQYHSRRGSGCGKVFQGKK